jgi:hypothetical protein
MPELKFGLTYREYVGPNFFAVRRPELQFRLGVVAVIFRNSG